MAAFEGEVAADLVNVFSAPTGGRVVATLAWGDPVRVLGKASGTLKVQIGVLITGKLPAVVRRRPQRRVRDVPDRGPYER